MPHWQGVVANVTVTVKTTQKAIEVTDALFHRFDPLINFIVGFRSEHRDLGVLNSKGWRPQRAILSKNGRLGSTLRNLGVSSPITLNSPHFMRSDIGFDYVWTFFFNLRVTEMQRAITMAIYWLGQATMMTILMLHLFKLLWAWRRF